MDITRYFPDAIKITLKEDCCEQVGDFLWVYGKTEEITDLLQN